MWEPGPMKKGSALDSKSLAAFGFLLWTRSFILWLCCSGVVEHACDASSSSLYYFKGRKNDFGSRLQDLSPWALVSGPGL